MATEACGMHLLGAMDNLWFHQIILFSEQSLLLSPEITQTPHPTSDSADFSSSQISQTSCQETSSLASITTNSQDESNSCEEIDERPTRLNLASKKTRFHSSSPLSSQKQLRNRRYSRKLEKSMSCKSLEELEIEEVKGFMDLGFVFKKDSLDKNMISLIPGLQRIESREIFTNDSGNVEEDDDDEDEGDEVKKRVMRPYLSEAWIVKRPDSPLLNLRIPRVSTAEDMKKHLKNWARTVASAVQLES